MYVKNGRSQKFQSLLPLTTVTYYSYGQRPPRARKFISSVVLDPSQWFFDIGEEIAIAWPLRRKRRPLVVQNPIIIHDNARSHTAAVTELLRCWQWDILEHPPYSPDMSPCDYDLFAKVKGPLRGTRYNTRDELIRAIGRSIRNINKDGRADGVRRLTNIWKEW